MRTSILHLARLVFLVLPETRAFPFKSLLLRLAGARVGANVRICSSARVLGSGELEIGDGAWIGQDVLIVSSSKVSIGSSVDIGPRVFIGTGTHEMDPFGVRSAGTALSKDVVIGSGAWLCANSVVLPGVTIGEKAVLAAGGVAAEDVLPRTVAGGVPAKGLRPL